MFYYVKRAFSILIEEGILMLIEKSFSYMFPQKWFVIKTKLNEITSKFFYNFSDDPYKTLVIDPSIIDQALDWRKSSIKREKYAGLGQIRAGGWDNDKFKTDIDNHWKIQGLIQRFKYNRDWEKTNYYKHLKNNLEDDKSDEEYISKRCENYDELYRDIKKNGYKTGDVERSKRPDVGPEACDSLEVLVAIDRDGNILLFEGYHRFAIALSLDIKIPVQVVCRHKRWLQTRQEMDKRTIGQGKSSHPESHPDISC